MYSSVHGRTWRVFPFIHHPILGSVRLISPSTLLSQGMSGLMLFLSVRVESHKLLLSYLLFFLLKIESNSTEIKITALKSDHYNLFDGQRW